LHSSTAAAAALPYFFLLYDATDLKANELQLRRARDAAEQAMKSRTEFLSMVSHELRNPLSAVLGTTDLLENERLTPTQQDYTRLIRSQGEDLLRIIQDVLDFGRLSAGKMEAEIGPGAHSIDSP
jgi:two-component system sensor histidine kinase/response regulator